MKSWITNRYNGLVFGRTRTGEYMNAMYSLRLFLKYSFTSSLRTEQNLKSFIIKQYHIIEKGLAMPAPRQNFGIPKIKLLLAKTRRFEKQYGRSAEISEPVRNALKEYLSANPNLKDADSTLLNDIESFIREYVPIHSEGGIKSFSKDQLQKYTAIDFENFVSTRTSVRNFSEERVGREDVEKACRIARNAPSVCNRQNWRLHYYDDPEMKNKLLGLQHGNTGFTDSIKGLFVVTSDIEGFTRMEQNQIFVDGGLISMNLVLSLHHLGIGSCCLNTCFPYTREETVKKVGEIPDNERLIMMIGIGYWKDDFKVAYSKKKEVNEILRIH